MDKEILPFSNFWPRNSKTPIHVSIQNIHSLSLLISYILHKFYPIPSLKIHIFILWIILKELMFQFFSFEKSYVFGHEVTNLENRVEFCIFKKIMMLQYEFPSAWFLWIFFLRVFYANRLLHVILVHLIFDKFDLG